MSTENYPKTSAARIVYFQFTHKIRQTWTLATYERNWFNIGFAARRLGSGGRVHGFRFWIASFLFGFSSLTIEPNKEVGAIQPKAMPIILTTPDEIESWMIATTSAAMKLQRPLPVGALTVVVGGERKDG